MQKKLSPTLISLIQETCGKVFWYKNDLSNFLRLHRIPEVNFVPLKEMTKVEFLGKLFYALSGKMGNNGHQIIYEIGANLCEMTSFPYLERKEETKSMIPAAKDAIANLKPHIDKIKSLTDDETRRQHRIEREEEIRKQRNLFLENLSELKEELDLLATQKLGTQEGGYSFEKWLIKLFNLFDIHTIPAYREASGRQIDMAFTLDGLQYIVEAKFTNNPAQVTDIDSFNAKIRKMADGTKGLMISMSGFSPGAKVSASNDRTWILMLDYSHMYSLIFNDAMRLDDVIRRILRNASQMGESYLSVNNF